MTIGRVNREAGDGLEIPIKMKLVGNKKSDKWIKAIDHEINYVVYEVVSKLCKNI